MGRMLRNAKGGTTRCMYTRTVTYMGCCPSLGWLFLGTLNQTVLKWAHCFSFKAFSVSGWFILINSTKAWSLTLGYLQEQGILGSCISHGVALGLHHSGRFHHRHQERIILALPTLFYIALLRASPKTVGLCRPEFESYCPPVLALSSETDHLKQIYTMKGDLLDWLSG